MGSEEFEGTARACGSDLQTPLRNGAAMTAITNQKLQGYLRAATSDNTRRAYRSAVRQFQRWGGRLPCDSRTVTQYLADQAGVLNPRSLSLHCAALGAWHRYQGFPDPTLDPSVRKTLKGVRRIHGRPARRARALSLEDLGSLLGFLQRQPESLKAYRDRALLLVGFFGGFRRSELVGIQVEDLVWDSAGVLVQLQRSKTDQEGEGLSRALPNGPSEDCCPVTALSNWLSESEIAEGPIFRPVNRWDQVRPSALSAGAINGLLKEWGKACGFEFVPDLSSHSLRRGMSTSAARAGADFQLIKRQGGWVSDAVVWKYIEEGQLLEENAGIPLLDKLAEWMANKK